jgi:hypothetical protein
MIEAYLNPQAFLAIVSSSIEVFHKETIGYLVGIKGEDRFVVEYAIPYQTAESGFAHATIDMRRVERINEIFGKLAQGLAYIGDFHSHTEFGELSATVIPSMDDLRTSKPGELNIICAVNNKGRRVNWYEGRRGILIGTIGEYRIEIGGYYIARPHIGFKYRRVRIKCPTVTGIIQEEKK